MENAHPKGRKRPPVVLIVDDQEWSTRSIESILAPNGFAVMRAYTGKKGLERAHTYRPDVIVIDANLPDTDSLELCRSLRDDPAFGDAMPILLTTSERPSRRLRLEALRAGAWDFLSYPIDAEELVLRLEAFVGAKLEADRRREEGLVDDLTGFYNLRGLERRVHELTSWAYRQHGALACVVLAPESDGAAQELADVMATELAQVIKRTGRISDVVGRLGKNEFAILAPGTDAAGAVRLAERLAEAAQKTASEGDGNASELHFRAGYDVVPDVTVSPDLARDVLVRATKALRKSKRGESGEWIVPFEVPTIQH